MLYDDEGNIIESELSDYELAVLLKLAEDINEDESLENETD